MSDIVDRLRKMSVVVDNAFPQWWDTTCIDAADTIDRLTAELADKKEILRQVIEDSKEYKQRTEAAERELKSIKSNSDQFFELWQKAESRLAEYEGGVEVEGVLYEDVIQILDAHSKLSHIPFDSTVRVVVIKQ